MTKTARLSFIASICRKVRGTRTEVISALPSEVREETRLAAVHNDDEGILDEGVELSAVSPSIARMVKPKARYLTPKQELDEEEGNHLTPTEHRQLAVDLEVYRRTHIRQPSYSKRLWLAIIPADPFETMKRAEPAEMSHA